MRILSIMRLATAMLAALATPLAAAPPEQAARTARHAAAPRTILFIGNSFTQGAQSPVLKWGAASVNDLNGGGIGGVPALFKAFAEQTGLNYAVSSETHGGKTLGFHYDERRQRFDRPWDVVVLQEYSTLHPERPGDARDYLRDVRRLSALFRTRNPSVRTWLMATWSRADLAYRKQSPWRGKPIPAMANDLRAAADRARTNTPGIAGVLPVGEAWNRAFAAGVADPDPYDGITPGQVGLWADDQYHASVAGYYLEALVVFGRVTGVDPRTLGRDERAARSLGLAPAVTASLQRIAYQTLSPVGR